MHCKRHITISTAFLRRRLCFALFLSLLTLATSAQNFNVLHDYDSTSDWGDAIFHEKNGGFTIVSTSHKKFQNGISLNRFSTLGMLDTKNIFSEPSASFYVSTWPIGGKVKRVDNKYIIPVSVEYPKSVSDFYASAGIVLLDTNGTFLAKHTYTDTAAFKEHAEDVLITGNAFFLIGDNKPVSGTWNNYKALLLHINNTTGALKWSKTYSKVNNIHAIDILPNGNLLLGGYNWHPAYVSVDLYYKKFPVFMLVDSATGAVLKDTTYNVGYTGGGSIAVDKNGGYYHWGFIDKIVGNHLDHPETHPAYVAHLDANFRIDWITHMVPAHYAHNYIRCVRQLDDSCYLVIGSQKNGPSGNLMGWAAKVDRNGKPVWDNTYLVDKDHHAYLVDGIELPDGSFAFTGSARNNANPSWRKEDIWLLKVDSNGCEIPGCTPTAIRNVAEHAKEPVAIYPNPTNGSFTFTAKEHGVLYICNLQGQVLGEQKITEKESSLQLPASATPGVYVARFVSENNRTTVLKLAYQP